MNDDDDVKDLNAEMLSHMYGGDGFAVEPTAEKLAEQFRKDAALHSREVVDTEGLDERERFAKVSRAHAAPTESALSPGEPWREGDSVETRLEKAGSRTKHRQAKQLWFRLAIENAIDEGEEVVDYIARKAAKDPRLGEELRSIAREWKLL
jgi:hypothetical protein